MAGRRVGSHALASCGRRARSSDHIHLLVHVGDRPLGCLMQRIGTRFARTMQKRMRTTGHLFERRYHALLVDVDSYFLELLRYIHLNPVRARMVASPEQYPWSSHHDYLATQPRDWITTDSALRMFSADASRARDLYLALVTDGIGAPSDPSLYRGHSKESRVLGDDQFLAKLNLSLPRRDPCLTLEQICMDVCRELDVTLEALRSASRKRTLTTARGRIAARAVDGHIAGSPILHRSVAALYRSADRHRSRQ